MSLSDQYILAIETSCDDTSVALVRQDGFVLGQLQASQDQRHQVFGGVVPEIASRAHTEVLMPLVDKLLQQNQIKLSDVAGLAVTSRPGLIGSLLVGVVSAKTLAQMTDLPLVSVNHLHGHIAAPLLWDQKTENPSLGGRAPKFPWLVLAVSGGHTSLYYVASHLDFKILGTTRDDAAGEAFDKFAKMAGLGFPGGAEVDKLARQGQPGIFKFTTVTLPDYAFSFSGIKSAAERALRESAFDIKLDLANLAASYQAVIVDSLLFQVEQAFSNLEVRSFMVTGGVSANTELRAKAEALSKQHKVPLFAPPLRYCTDNAAMIGLAGWWYWDTRFEQGQVVQVSASPANLEGDFTKWKH